MKACAEAVDAAYARESAADDARRVFLQVAPVALADDAVMSGADLDPVRATAAMIATVRGSSYGPDFASTPMAEQYFREIVEPTLRVMFINTDFIARISPALWREVLGRHGIQIELLASVKEDTAETLMLVRELLRTKQTTVPEDTLIAMARKIRPRIANAEEALHALDQAADLAAEQLARGDAGNNVDGFVDSVLRSLAELTREGRLDEAAVAANASVELAEAGLIQLLDAAISQHLLIFDSKGAARLIVRRVCIKDPDPSNRFDVLLQEQTTWYERGKNHGTRLDLEVAIALARQAIEWPCNEDQQDSAVIQLGSALHTIGARDVGTESLIEARDVYKIALNERMRERTPLVWATIQNNLGNAFRSLGERESGTDNLWNAVIAYDLALEEQSRLWTPLEWARTQSNRGATLANLAEKLKNIDILDSASASLCLALKEQNAINAPLEWAGTLGNLGAVFTQAGDWLADTRFLRKAVSAFRLSLKRRTREIVPFYWATTQTNLANALTYLGVREENVAFLLEAVAAYDLALEERTPIRNQINWAKSSGNQGIAFRYLAQFTLDIGIARRARDQIAKSEAVLRTAEHGVYADYYAAQLSDAENLVDNLSKN